MDYDQAESKLNESRSNLRECDTHITRITADQQKLQQKLSDSAVERKKMENEVLHWSCLLLSMLVWKLDFTCTYLKSR